MAALPLRLDVSDILDRPGASRSYRGHLAVPVAALASPIEVAAEVLIQAIPDGLAVTGTLGARVQTVCSRCLEPIEVPVDVEFQEAFLAPGDETEDAQAYPIEGAEIDLEPMLADSLALSLPAYPRCDEACPGLCPSCGASRRTADCGCEAEAGDPRLAILADLHLNRKD